MPGGQHGAVLVDEERDFEADWLKLVLQMIDENTRSLLLLCGDAQSKGNKGAGLNCTLSSVGVQAVRRTTKLRLYYRNTREILDLAKVAREFIDPHEADQDDMTLITPESAGISGEPLFVCCLRSLKEGITFFSIAFVNGERMACP